MHLRAPSRACGSNNHSRPSKSIEPTTDRLPECGRLGIRNLRVSPALQFVCEGTSQSQRTSRLRRRHPKDDACTPPSKAHEPSINRTLQPAAAVKIRVQHTATAAARSHQDHSSSPTHLPAAAANTFVRPCQGAGRRFSHRTTHFPSSGNPGAFLSGAPSHPAAIIATA